MGTPSLPIDDSPTLTQIGASPYRLIPLARSRWSIARRTQDRAIGDAAIDSADAS
jgi:hypothetical protein